MLHLAIAAGLVLGLIVGLLAAATGNEWLLAIASGSADFGNHGDRPLDTGIVAASSDREMLLQR